MDIPAPPTGRVFPPFGDDRSFRWAPSPEENRLARFLDDALPPSWEIYRRPYMNGEYPALAVLHPEVGLVVYDIYPESVDRLRRETVGKYTRYRIGDRDVQSPASLVRGYLDNLTGLHAPRIGADLREHKAGGRTLRTGLYCPGVTTETAQRHVPVTSSTCLVFGDDALALPNEDPAVEAIEPYTGGLFDVVPEAFRPKHPDFRTEWAAELRAILSPPFHAVEEGEPIRLTSHQERYARPSPGKTQRLRGVAGCGKTLVLAQRAARLAAEGHRSLIVHFNVTLANYIRPHIDRAPMGFARDLYTVVHFHEWCKQALNTVGTSWPTNDEKYADRLPDWVHREMKRKGLPVPSRSAQINVANGCKQLGISRREALSSVVLHEVVPSMVSRALDHPRCQRSFAYDAILIDEGQDFCRSWYDVLCKTLSRDGEVLLVSDRRQNLYDRDTMWAYDPNPTDQSIRPFSGRWGELAETYRLPPIASKAAAAFGEAFFPEDPQELRDAPGATAVQMTLESDPAFYAGRPRLIWRNKDARPEMVSSAVRWLATDQNVHPQDVVALVLSHEEGDDVSQALQAGGFSVNQVNADRHSKESFVLNDGRVKVSTVHSFKGWELRHVILLMSERGAEGARSDEVLDRIVYTALTRTRHHLFVFNELDRYREFGARWPTAWKWEAQAKALK